jgi:hypothetical protein
MKPPPPSGFSCCGRLLLGGAQQVNGDKSHYTHYLPCLVQLTDVATTPVKYGPIQYALPEESTLPKTRKAKKSADRHIERSTSFRLGHIVLKAADVIAREESAARGERVSRADIIREAVMERYRRRKVKRKG